MPTRIALLAIVALVLLTGCGSSGRGKTATPTTVASIDYADKTSDRTVTIEARDDFFTPEAVKIRVGTTVVFENHGRNDHNVLSADGSFHDIKADAFAPGMKASVVFSKVGTHGFSCSLHGSPTAGMRGSILVVP